MSDDYSRIIFYDGECGLCQRSIALLSRWDLKKNLSFAPLNGEVYKKKFKDVSNMSTVVYYDHGRFFTKSDAIIEAGKAIGGIKSWLVLLKIIPRFIRDAIYDFIAVNRKKVSCIILKKDERFLN